MKGALLVAGTSSDAGKSLLCAGICRWLARQGVSVAPFKAQNMALNSVVTRGGSEVGRAQAVQAAAAGAELEAAMNPVLIKPSGERHSQVVVMGKPYADVSARSYRDLVPELRPIVLDALSDLRSRYDVVICEGAGSPAEINLRASDLTNMWLAREAEIATVVVTDIDRGGSFASLFGTLALLEPADQTLVSGFIFNKFRGDLGVLAPGLEQLAQLTGRPTLGVVPFADDVWLDAEDSLALSRPLPGGEEIDVVVVGLRYISNFTDVDALAAEPGVRVRFSTSPMDIARADLVVIPGTKATVEDLARLRARGLDRALADRAAGGRLILGICGGYQMLGETIVDEVESRQGAADGLGLLPIRTEFAPDKVLANHGDRGYEIHHGRITRHGGTPLIDPDEGCAVDNVLGTSWHAVLENDAFRRGLLQRVAPGWTPGTHTFADLRAAQLDRVGDLVAQHLDTAALTRLIQDGAPGELPIIETETRARLPQ